MAEVDTLTTDSANIVWAHLSYDVVNAYVSAPISSSCVLEH